MAILFSFLSVIFGFASVIGLFWTVIGIPVGVILFILKHFNKIQESKKKLLWICFGGVILLIASFVLYFIVSVIQGFLGIPSTLSLPKTP